MSTRITALLFLSFCLNCASPVAVENEMPSFEPGMKAIRVLFVGNSLTYTNNMPVLLAELAAMDQVTLTSVMIAPGGYSLEDHWNDGVAKQEMLRGPFDIVIGQQGPSALPESQVLLKAYAAKFADECKRQNTPWGLYMVWPSEARFFDLDNVIYSYSQAASTTNALLCPAGLAWKLAWAEDPQLALYGGDRFHPSIKGSLLAAMTIYVALQAKEDLSFINVKGASWERDVTDAELEILKRAAINALKGK